MPVWLPFHPLARTVHRFVGGGRPAIVRTLSSREMMNVSTLENLHRQSISRIDLVLILDRIRRRSRNLVRNAGSHCTGPAGSSQRSLPHNSAGRPAFPR